MFGQFYAPLSSWGKSQIEKLSEKAYQSEAAFDAWFDAIEALRAEPEPPFPDDEDSPFRTEAYAARKWEKKLRLAIKKKASDFDVYALLCKAISDPLMPAESLAIFTGPWPEYYARVAKVDEGKAAAWAAGVLHYQLTKSDVGRAFCVQALPYAIRGVERAENEDVFRQANELTSIAEYAHATDYYPAMGAVLVKRAYRFPGNLDQHLMGYRALSRVADGLDPQSPLLAQMQEAGGHLLKRASRKDLAETVICAVRWLSDPLLSNLQKNGDALLEETTRFVIGALPRYARLDPLAALKASGAVLGWSEKVEDPAVREQALAVWQERIKSYMQIDPKEISFFMVDMAKRPDAVRQTVARLWCDWETLAYSLYAEDPVQGIGFAALSLVAADTRRKVIKMSRGADAFDKWVQSKPDKRSEFAQLSAQTSHMQKICADLCRSYKRRHPIDAFNRGATSYIFSDGRSPYIAFPSVNQISGLCSPSLAISCMRDFVNANPTPPAMDTEVRPGGRMYFLP